MTWGEERLLLGPTPGLELAVSGCGPTSRTYLRSTAKSDLSHSEFSVTFAYTQAYCEHMYNYFQ